jgi:lipopolysaccharide export LptBFGC system permease protein LptF
MVYKMLKTYKYLLDQKIKDSLVIVIIAFFIIWTGIIIPQSNITQANILAIQKQNNKKFETIINIDWKKYKLYLEEIK